MSQQGSKKQCLDSKKGDDCLRFNLGCGKDIKPGFINLDHKGHGDGFIDLEKPLPFKDKSTHEIVLRHTLEHITNRVQLMEECTRVLTEGGVLRVTLPSCGYVHMDHKVSVCPPFYMYKWFGGHILANPEIDYPFNCVEFRMKKRSVKSFFGNMFIRASTWILSFFYGEYTWVLQRV